MRASLPLRALPLDKGVEGLPQLLPCLSFGLHGHPLPSEEGGNPEIKNRWWPDGDLNPEPID